jgi:hypothetical protein
MIEIKAAILRALVVPPDLRPQLRDHFDFQNSSTHWKYRHR